MKKNSSLNRTQAAQNLRVSVRTVHNLVLRGQLRQRPDGKFLKSELDKFKASYGVDKDGKDYASLKAQVDLRIRLAKAALVERQLQILTGDFAPVAEFYRVGAERVKEISTGLINWSNSLPPLLEGLNKHEMTVILTAEARSLLERFSRTGSWVSVPDDKK